MDFRIVDHRGTLLCRVHPPHFLTTPQSRKRFAEQELERRNFGKHTALSHRLECIPDWGDRELAERIKAASSSTQRSQAEKRTKRRAKAAAEASKARKRKRSASKAGK